MSDVNKNKGLKNREDTSQRIIKAVGDLIAEKGFSTLGVNAVARQAGVDKVLIYRYFDGIDGLYRAYAESADFWPSIEEIVGEGHEYESLKEQPFHEIMGVVFRQYTHAIRSRPQTLEILAWETVERNALTIELEKIREARGLELMARLQEIDAPEADWLAIINMFVASIHYLLIRGRKVQTFTGMDLTGDEAWERLNNTIEFLSLSVCLKPSSGK